MTNWLKKLWAYLTGKAKKKVKEEIDPKPLTETPCGCDVGKPLSMPPFTADELAAMGNASECPTIGGLDIRMRVMPPNDQTWLVGQLLPQACLTVNPVSCQCFSLAGGRMHFVGYSYNDDSRKNMIGCKAGQTFAYRTTTFLHYDYFKG